MKRYVALLRGINISGKNKIAMSELKAGFAELGYTAVSTYLNSGNVVFCADIDDKERLSNEIRSMINKRFGLDIPVFVVSQEELEDILKNAPEWWGDSNKEIYDNLIFMFPDISYDSFYNEVGNPKEEYEKSIIIKMWFSGLLAAKIIKKQIGGQKLPVQRSVTELRSGRQIQ